MSPPLLPQDITMTSETEETVLDLTASIARITCDLGLSDPGGPPGCRVSINGEQATTVRSADLRALLAALSRAPDAGREGAAERLAIVAEKPARLIRWGEGDRLDLQSVLAALSPPSTGGEGEAVAWRCLNVHGDAFLTEDANGAHFWLKSGKPVQPLYLHPSPEMGEISRAAVLRMIGDAFQDGGGCVEGHDWSWDVVEFKAVANKLADKLKENGLSREELGGLARSQPGSDAQERSPVPPLSDGGEVWLGGTISDCLKLLNDLAQVKGTAQ